MADESGFENVAYFTGGGAEHSPELMRLLPYAIVGSIEGVIEPGDLTVMPLEVPGGRVRMAPGAAILLNRHVQNPRESYIVRAPEWSYIDIPPTGPAGARTDLIGVRVEDPQYDGWADPPSEDAALDWQYVMPFRIPNVDPNIRHAAELNLGYAAYACALVTLPANTGTVIDQHIFPLRNLALPRSEAPILESAPLTNWFHAVDTVAFKRWPVEGREVRIPRWATHMSAKIDLAGILRTEGSIGADLRARFGDFLTAANLTVEYDAGPGAATEARESFFLTIGGAVPADKRGAVVELWSEARRVFPESYPGYLRTAPGGQIAWDIRFYQYTV